MLVWKPTVPCLFTKMLRYGTVYRDALRGLEVIKSETVVCTSHVVAAAVLLCIHLALRVGPRPELHFNPKEVRGAIVTCGGLCPGLNSVVHHLVETLLLTYKADKVCRFLLMFESFFVVDNGPDFSAD